MSGPATVLYLVDGLGLSGKTKAMVDLIGGLDPDRFRAHVITFDTEGSPLYDRLRKLDVPVSVIACPAQLNVGVMARIGAVVRRLRPEVIHCYNPRTMLYGGAVARLARVRAILGTLSAFACLTPDAEYRFLPQRLLTTSAHNRLRNRLAARLVCAIVTVSPTLGQNFCRYNGIDVGRLRVVPYGVDVERFKSVPADRSAAFRGRHNIAPDAIVVGSVGRLVEQKDYPTQLRAFALAATRNPALVMLLVGEGPLHAEIEALAGSLGIAGRVRFAGHSNEVPVALRAMDIYVLASKFEPYGVAILEAKAAGTAIVATRVNEVAEILSEDAARGDAAGRLVPPEDPAAMAEAFVALAADPGLRRALGARAAREAAERHSLRAAIDAYQGLYDELRGGAVRTVAAEAAL